MSIQEQITDCLSFAMTDEGQNQIDQQVGWFLKGSMYSFQTSSCYESIVDFARYRSEYLRYVSRSSIICGLHAADFYLEMLHVLAFDAEAHFHRALQGSSELPIFLLWMPPINYCVSY